MCFGAIALYSCDNSSDDNSYTFDPATKSPMGRKFNRPIFDLSYGDDPQQTMDVYFPTKPKEDGSASKVFVVVHGGGWYSGDKADVNYEAFFIRTIFPEYTVVNLNYRLATASQLGYPRQIRDISQAIGFLDEHAEQFRISREYAMIGVSAGAHLSMLYSYKYDSAHEVKAVCSIVGPTDFSDPNYQGNVLYYTGLNLFTGLTSYSQNPSLYQEISPVYQVSDTAPKTLMFYGDADPLVANTQGKRLSNKLTEHHIYNELYQYPGAGHANWNSYQQTHVNEHTAAFFKANF